MALQSKYEELIRTLPVAFFEVDFSGRIVYLNEFGLQFVGYAESELRKSQILFLNMFAAEEHARVFGNLNRVLHGEMCRDKDTFISRKNGEKVPVSCYFCTSSNPKIAFTGAFLDMSKAREAETAFKEEQILRRTIEESIPAGIIAVNEEIMHIYVNPFFSKMVGWEEKELLGTKPPFLYWPPEEQERIVQSMRGIIKSGQYSGSFESVFRRREGNRFDVHVQFTEMKNAQGKRIGWIGAITDITAHKSADRILHQSEHRLRQLSSQLITSQEMERKRIAQEIHDSLAAQLAAVKYSLERRLAQEKGAAGPAIPLEGILELVQNAIGEARQITSNLRPAMLDDLGILPTISWFCREFQKVYSTIRIEAQTKIEEEDVPDHLKLVIFRVLQESLNNTAKHSGAQNVWIDLMKREDKIHLSIRDDGKGFDAKSSKRDGLGLTGMSERVQFSGGEFSIESAEEKGTTVQAEWPLSGSSSG